jgi:hypothetical protein
MDEITKEMLAAGVMARRENDVPRHLTPWSGAAIEHQVSAIYRAMRDAAPAGDPIAFPAPDLREMAMSFAIQLLPTATPDEAVKAAQTILAFLNGS